MCVVELYILIYIHIQSTILYKYMWFHKIKSCRGRIESKLGKGSKLRIIIIIINNIK